MGASIIRHRGRTNLHHRESDITRAATAGHARQTRRQSMKSMDARRAVARAQLRNGWDPAVTRELLDILGLTITAAAVRRNATVEANVNAGRAYRRNRYGTQTGVADLPRPGGDQ